MDSNKKTHFSIGPFFIIFCCLLWATDTLFRYSLLTHFKSIEIVFMEHFFALLFLLPVLFKNTTVIRCIKPREWLALGFIGIFGSGIATLCLTSSYNYINPSIALILQKLQPVIAISFAHFFLGERVSKIFYVFSGLSVFGAFLLIYPELNLDQPISLNSNITLGVLLALIATASWGLCTVFGRYITATMNYFTSTALRFLFGFVGIYFIFIYNNLKSDGQPFSLLNRIHMSNFPALAYISIVSGIIAMNLYYFGLKRTSASHAAIYELSLPVFAVIINSLFLGKFLTFIQLIGSIIIVLSVLMINRLRTPQ